MQTPLASLTTPEILWSYLAKLQPSLELLLSCFGYEDAYVSVAKSTEGTASEDEPFTPFGSAWIVDHGTYMDGHVDEFIRAAEDLTTLVANFGDSTDNFTSSKAMPAGYGTINQERWIVVVTGPDAEVICAMIARMVTDAIEGYENYLNITPLTR